MAAVAALPDDAEICGCNGVCKGKIIGAIADKGLTTLDDVRAHTKASASCGSCTGLVEQLLTLTLGDDYNPARRTADVQLHRPRPRRRAPPDPRQGAEDRSPRSCRSWTGRPRAAAPRAARRSTTTCSAPGRANTPTTTQSRFVNERVHANIQKDGTYSVVPRMWGGVTTPSELRAIADVVDKFNIPTVKVTGGQRIDLLGVKKEDLPAVWADLNAAGMVSGHAYAKALRTVKTCVGTEWCRFGTQDSTGLGVKHREVHVGLVDAGQGQARGLRLPAQLRRGDAQGLRRRSASTPATRSTSAARRASTSRAPSCSARSTTEDEVLEYDRARSSSSTASRAATSSASTNGSSASASTTIQPQIVDDAREAAARCYERFVYSQNVRAGRSLGRARRRQRRARVHSRWPTVGSAGGCGMSDDDDWFDIGAARRHPAARRALRGATPRRRDRGVPHRATTRSSRSTTAARTRAARSARASCTATRSPARCTTGSIALDTGEALGADEGCVPTIPVRVEDGRIFSARVEAALLAAGGLMAERDPHHLPLLRRRLRRRSRRAPATARSRSRGDPEHPANFGRLCSKGTALGETVGLDGRLLHPDDRRRAGRAGTRRSTSSPRRFARNHRRARAGRGRLLRLRPVADRGLLRRQQADEGLHRLGQHRHQFAAVHGVARSPATSAPSAPTWCPAATRISSTPTSSCWSARTSPGAIRCSIQRHRGGREARARHEGRRHRSAPHDDGRYRRSASADQAGQRRRAVRRTARASGAHS